MEPNRMLKCEAGVHSIHKTLKKNRDGELTSEFAIAD
jgi:hypothetical protein